MKHVWKMLMAALLVCTLLMPAGAVAEEVKRYAEARQDNVAVRQSPEAGATPVLTLAQGYEVEVVDLVIDSETTRVSWLKVECINPVTGTVVTGYIAWSDAVFGITPDSNLAGSTTPGGDKEDEDPKEDVPQKPSVDDTLDKDVVVSPLKMKVKAALNVGVYDEPSNEGELVTVLPADTVADVTGYVSDSANNIWYRLSYNGKVGFVPSALVQPITDEDDDADKEEEDANVTAMKAKAKAVLEVSAYSKPSIDGKVVVTIPAKTVVDVTGYVSGTPVWYRVSYSGKTGYVPGSMLEMQKEEDEPVYKVIGKGVTQNTNGVNLRTAPSTSSESQGKLVSGIEVELLSIPEKFDSNHWFMVRYDGKVGYIQAPYIKVITGGSTGDEDNKVVEIGLIVNTTGVNVREKADKNSTSLGKLTAGDYIEVLEVPEKFDTNHWFKVLFEGKVGYIQAPYVRVPSMDGEDEEDDPTEDPTDAPLYTIEGVIQNTNGVNFREKADKSSTSMGQLKAGTKVTVVFPLPEKFTEKYWFQVIYNGKTGYIQAPYVKIAGITDKPTEAPSDEPTLKPEDESMIGIGLIQNTDGVNFREKADVNSTSMAQLKAGTLVDVIKAPTVNDTKHWFRVRYNGKVGYIQAPYVYLPGWVFTGEEEPTPTPDADVVADGVIQNTNGVNFRKAATVASDSMGLLKAGVKVEILEIPDEINTSSFFKVRYDGKVGYIQAPYVRVLAPGEDPDKPASTPEWDDDVVGLGMITSTNGVNFREGPSIHYDSLGKLSAGMQVYLLKIPSGTDADNWFKIRYNGKDGYIQAPYVVVLQGEIPEEEGNNAAIGVGVVTSTNGVNFRTGPSKEYGTMGKIPFDTAVDLLSAPSIVDEDHWYKVAYNGKTGYVQAPFIRVVTINAGALPDVSLYGYAKLLQSTANLRDSASGNTVVTWKGKDSLLRIAGDSVTSGYYEWIPVFYPADSAIYYVRADMVQIVMVENGQIVTPTPAPASRYGYVLTTGQNVNLRIQPDEESIAKIPKGTVLVCVDDPLDPWNSDYTWYEVVYNGMYGYVRGDYVVVCDRNGTPIVDEEDKDPEEDEEITILGYIRVKALTAGNRVNLRDKQAGNRIGLLDDGLILPVIEAKTAAGVYGQYGWYKVKTADGLVGYVRDDCAVVCDKNGNDIKEPDLPTESVVSGYVMVTGNNVYVRQTPFGVGLGNVATSSVWPIVGETKTSNSITWYNIKAYDIATGKEITGYIHGDYVYKLTDAEAKKYEADNTYRPNVSDKPVVDPKANYVITVNTNGLNLRASYSQDSNSLYQVKSGVVMEYIGTKQVGTVTWYNVIYKDIELWAHGNYLQVMTTEEYKAWLAQNPDFEPNVADFLGYVVTTVKNAPVLNAADGSKTVATIETKGRVVNYYTNRISAGGDSWYRVYVDGKFGYINADYVQLCDASGEPLKPDVTDAEKTQQETTYSTLKKGNSGDAVANLVQELINQGYYQGKVTSSFTTAVKEAVELFQEVHGLDVDGIADSATQHALFGTVPIGAGDTNNLYFPIYKVEKIDWFDGGIQQMIPRGANFKIYDVKTGIVWWAHRWAGSYHADIETLTKADTKRLCQIYGVSNLQQIVDENMWQRRPCLVTIGTRTFACSLDGMQHNPDGDTIGNNGMDGQICLHFTNSLGHSSGAVSDSHSEAIQYAYTFDYTGRPGYMGK